MRYLEDVRIGDKAELGQHTFTAEGIKAFAERFDPQPFHVDEAAASRTHYGGLVASGWHTAAVCMRLMAAHLNRMHAAARERGEPTARAGVSPGFRDLQWLKPVYPGDTIRYATEVVGKRPLESRPDWGLVLLRNTGINQAGDLVFSVLSALFVERRHR
jgi:acyl dehydratase